MGTQQIVNRINALLAEKGISKKQFYSDCDITSASFSLWNKGKTQPTLKNLEKIADYLGVSIAYLMSGYDSKKDPAANGEVTEELIKVSLIGDYGRYISNDAWERIRAFARFTAEEDRKGGR